jgi:hypothetical protein
LPGKCEALSSIPVLREKGEREREREREREERARRFVTDQQKH